MSTIRRRSAVNQQLWQNPYSHLAGGRFLLPREPFRTGHGAWALGFIRRRLSGAKLQPSWRRLLEKLEARIGPHADVWHIGAKPRTTAV